MIGYMRISCVLQRKERAEQIAYKLEQDLALCKCIASFFCLI